MALLSCCIPEVRRDTCDTFVIVSEERLIWRTDAFESGRIHDVGIGAACFIVVGKMRDGEGVDCETEN